MTELRLTLLVFLLNPKIVALWIDLVAFGRQDSWGKVCEADLAGLMAVICASVWIKLFNLTGKHSRLSFIFLEKWKEKMVSNISLSDSFHLRFVFLCLLDVEEKVKNHVCLFGAQLLNVIFINPKSTSWVVRI